MSRTMQVRTKETPGDLHLMNLGSACSLLSSDDLDLIIDVANDCPSSLVMVSNLGLPETIELTSLDGV